MKAVAHTFADIELPMPAPAGRDLLVKVEAVSVNPVDTKQRRASPPAPLRVLGWDAAGTVAAAGSEASLFKPGDAVYYAGDVTRAGCDSEYHLVDERVVGAKPKSLDFAQAAAIPLTAITAWEGLFDRLKVRAGGTLLVIGGAGGVGSIAIQLARIAGLSVVATASRPESIAWVKDHGAEHVVNHHAPLRAQMEAIGKREVEYIACFNDLDQHWPAIGELVAPQGGIVAIVANREPLPMDTVRAKSATLAWELMFTRPRYRTPDMIEQHRLLGRVAEWLDSGKLRGTMRERLSPINGENLRAAHARLESGTMIGKLVLEGWG